MTNVVMLQEGGEPTNSAQSLWGRVANVIKGPWLKEKTPLIFGKGGDNPEIEAKYFPDIDPGVRPFGSRVLVQIRAAKSVSKGGIIFTDTTKDTERDNTQVAKVLSVGPLAYKNRNTMKDWTEGQWCQAGEYVFVPKYGGVRFERKLPVGTDGYDEFVQFAIIDDLNVIGAVDDPFNLKSFI